MKEIIKITLAVDGLVLYAKRVMKALEEQGPAVVPHLLENDGKGLKQAIRNLERILGVAEEEKKEGDDGK